MATETIKTALPQPMRGTLREFWKALTAPLNMTVLLILLAFFAGMLVSSARFEHGAFAANAARDVQQWWSGFMQNASTEMFGAFLTFILIEVLVEGRRARQTTEAELARNKALRDAELQVEKERLILQMGSPFNESAVEAARQLRWRKWLMDGSLKDANLFGANLEGAKLMRANLQRANLRLTNLQKAGLSGANLEEARLLRTNLKGANIRATNLQGTDRWRAILQEARLWGANLQGATRATIEQLPSARTLEGVTLPDGMRLPGRTLEERLSRAPEPDWRTPFEEWCKTVETDEDGYIIPAPVDDEDKS